MITPIPSYLGQPQLDLYAKARILGLIPETRALLPVLGDDVVNPCLYECLKLALSQTIVFPSSSEERDGWIGKYQGKYFLDNYVDADGRGLDMPHFLVSVQRQWEDTVDKLAKWRTVKISDFDFARDGWLQKASVRAQAAPGRKFGFFDRSLRLKNAWCGSVGKKFQAEFSRPSLSTVSEESRRGPLVTLPDKYDEKGWDLLQKRGMPRGAWFVCLHVRTHIRGFSIQRVLPSDGS